MTAQATAHQTDTAKHKLNPDLARQFLETIFSPYLKKASRAVYIEVRGQRETDPPGKMPFRRFYLNIDLLIKDMAQLARRPSITGSAWPYDGVTHKEKRNTAMH